jgi:uncharacterized membrane protein
MSILDGCSASAMDAYLIVKTVHVLSAAVLFGTGLGIAALMLFGHLAADPAARLFAARTTVMMDFLFTLPAVVLQPLSGWWLIARAGFDWSQLWLVAAFALYAFAGLCWLPVVAIQLRLKRMLEARAAGGPFDDAAYRRLFRLWFLLGWPAFGAVVVIYWLMVAKPTW